MNQINESAYEEEQERQKSVQSKRLSPGFAVGILSSVGQFRFDPV